MLNYSSQRLRIWATIERERAYSPYGICDKCYSNFRRANLANALRV